MPPPAKAGRRAALRIFLLHKLDAIDERNAPQLTMICTWLSEMYLHAIDAARCAGAESEAAVARGSTDRIDRSAGVCLRRHKRTQRARARTMLGRVLLFIPRVARAVSLPH